MGTSFCVAEIQLRSASQGALKTNRTCETEVLSPGHMHRLLLPPLLALLPKFQSLRSQDIALQFSWSAVRKQGSIELLAVSAFTLVSSSPFFPLHPNLSLFRYSSLSPHDNHNQYIEFCTLFLIEKIFCLHGLEGKDGWTEKEEEKRISRSLYT